jgi:hypothetical protein
MSRIQRVVVLSLSAWVCAAHALGCFFTLDLEQVDCDLYPHAGCTGGAGGTTTTTSTGGGGTGGDGGGGGPVDCTGEPNVTNTVEDCGVFVQADAADEMGDGTRDRPYKTLQEAIDKAGEKRVYACTSAPFAESVSVAAGIEIIGGFNCLKGWSWSADSKSKLNGAADQVVLTVASGAEKAKIENFAITATSTAIAGGSSIAVVVDHATAVFDRCKITAGNASDGEAGLSGGAQETQALGGTKGDDAGLAGGLAGGAGAANPLCFLIGGNGGNGGQPSNGNGQDGLPGDNGSGGAKGIGDTGAGCTGNPNGTNGTSMAFGPAVQGPGTIDASGYHGVDGLPGMDGTNGTSGGGGGGSKATSSAHGAGGGGGGAGGCGGKHGLGGKAGGSSIALLSLDAKSIGLIGCELAAGKGGNGGNGGDGQFGQLGGDPGQLGKGGDGAFPGCSGGVGGTGGNGGNGSGGLGGHSLGIALIGTAPVLDDATKKATLFGALGTGGKGGRNDADMNHGAPGNAAACWDFATNKSCLP